MPAGAINTIEDMFADPQIQARGLRIDLEDAAGTVIPKRAHAGRLVGNAV